MKAELSQLPTLIQKVMPTAGFSIRESEGSNSVYPSSFLIHRSKCAEPENNGWGHLAGCPRGGKQQAARADLPVLRVEDSVVDGLYP